MVPPSVRQPSIRRRCFLRRTLLATGAVPGLMFWNPQLFAEQLLLTPRLTEGPFYPDQLPLDTDNDLIIINESLTPAVGTITHLTGRVLSPHGEPVCNASVEIWQVDNHGVYLHSQSARGRQRDGNFQGYGRFLTNARGEYYFRTIKPTPYVGRTPHIHVAVNRHGRRSLTTQLFVKGEPQNEHDGIYLGIRDKAARESLLVDFHALPDSKLGELQATFDIVLGVTPQERDDGTLE